MSAKYNGYQPLTGSGRQSFSISRLWQASDHLLLSRNVLGVERYKRFYFSEVQALVTRRTRTFAVWNCLLGVGVAGFLGLLAYFYYAQPQRPRPSLLSPVMFPMTLTLGICAGVLLLFLLAHFFSGPTCTMHLQTRAGLEQLTAIRRRPAARKLTAKLLPLLAAAAASAGPVAEATPSAETGPATPALETPPSP